MRITFTPAQCLETWQEAINPTDAVAGLMSVTDAVLNQLPQELLTDARCEKRSLFEADPSRSRPFYQDRLGTNKKEKLSKKGVLCFLQGLEGGHADGSRAVCDGAKNASFEQFVYKADHFTKTGSGQTWEKLRKEVRISQVPALPVVENASSVGGHSRYHLTPAEYWSRNGECANLTPHTYVTRRDAMRRDVISHQPSAISHQPSAIRHQTLDISHQTSAMRVLNGSDLL